MLHTVIDHIGLADCGELIALATPPQLTDVLDIDLWRSSEPGTSERFHPERFGRWLEVMAEASDRLGARTLAGLDVDVITAAFARHVTVRDPAAARRQDDDIDGDVDGDGDRDGDSDEEAGAAPREASSRRAIGIGGFQVQATTAHSWDALIGALVGLEAEYPDYFQRLMIGCRRLSDGAAESDGLDNLLTAPEQAMYDARSARQERRERQGYATPVEARAFLQSSREPVTGTTDAEAAGAISAAYFRALETAPSGLPSVDTDAPDSLTPLVDVLVAEGGLSRPARPLLEDARRDAGRYARLDRHMSTVAELVPMLHAARSRELAFLANTIASGCAGPDAPFTPAEAAEVAVATCNLGLENWAHRADTALASQEAAQDDAAPLPREFLLNHDLVRVFQVGWRVLYEQVCRFAASRLRVSLAGIDASDRDARLSLAALRSQLRTQEKAGRPWLAREAMDVLATVDTPTWVALLGLIAECPVQRGIIGASPRTGTLSVSATDYVLISENRQIAEIRSYLEELPERLVG